MKNFCHNCGKKLDSDEIFCQQCGAKRADRVDNQSIVVHDLKQQRMAIKEYSEKEAGKGCLTVLLVWVVVSILFILFFNSINEVGASSGDIILTGIVIGLPTSVILSFSYLAIKRHYDVKNKTLPIKFVNPYVDSSQFDKGGELPKVNYSNIFLRSGEQIIYAVPVAIYKDKEKVVGYEGKGWSRNVKVTEKYSRSYGSVTNKAIRKNIREYYYGDYIVTNMRLVFIPKEPNGETFDISLNRVTSVTIVAEDAFILTWGNRSKNILVPKEEMKYAVGLTRNII